MIKQQGCYELNFSKLVLLYWNFVLKSYRSFYLFSCLKYLGKNYRWYESIHNSSQSIAKMQFVGIYVLKIISTKMFKSEIKSMILVSTLYSLEKF